MVLLTAVMHSKKEYDLVSDDGYDSQVPLHNEEAFKSGISFQSKYIGTLDVARPTTKVEIVAAMRRIRYEFKAKAIKKRKVTVIVSLDGVKVQLRKKRKKNQWQLEESRHLVLHHAIYRIFYVSHDSQDLKIWSYIARDGATNVFKCNVFKTYKKDQAMMVVRTIGQAFEVCHRLTGTVNTDEDGSVKEKTSDVPEETPGNNSASSETSQQSVDGQREKMTLPLNDPKTPQRRRLSVVGGTIVSPLSTPVPLEDDVPTPGLPLSAYHRLQLLGQQLEQQQQQTQIAIAQAHLLKDQLTAETAARIEAQARSHQLLLNNKELLSHMKVLVDKMREFELVEAGLPLTHLVDDHSPIPKLPDPTTLQCGAVYIINHDGVSPTINVPNIAMFENRKAADEMISPDSGHRDMSSESLSFAAANHFHLPKSVSESRDFDDNRMERVSNATCDKNSVEPLIEKKRTIHDNQYSPSLCSNKTVLFMNGNGTCHFEFDDLSPLQSNNFRHSMPESLINKCVLIGQNQNEINTQVNISTNNMDMSSVNTRRSDSMPLKSRECVTMNNGSQIGVNFCIGDTNSNPLNNNVLDTRCRTELKRFTEGNLPAEMDSAGIYAEIDYNTIHPYARNSTSQNSSTKKLENSLAEVAARRNVVINHVTESPRRCSVNSFSVQSHVFTPMHPRPLSDPFSRHICD